MLFSALPDAQGLYDPDNESDSCGVAMMFLPQEEDDALTAT